jgi:hypothetical protein
VLKSFVVCGRGGGGTVRYQGREWVHRREWTGYDATGRIVAPIIGHLRDKVSTHADVARERRMRGLVRGTARRVWAKGGRVNAEGPDDSIGSE